MSRTGGIDRYIPSGPSRNGRHDDNYNNLSKIDRYVPRNQPHDGPHHHPDDRITTSGSGGKSKLQDPHALSIQVPYYQFCEWYAQDHPEATLKNELLTTKYEDYKYDLYARLARGFVFQHKDEQWFREEYDPVIADERKRKISEYRKLCYKHYMKELDSGNFDNYSLQVKHGNTQYKILLIKTIAPHISRVQLEELVKDLPGFIFLSLSDPNPTKRYYRIGWVLFTTESDLDSVVEKLEGHTIRDEKNGDFTVHVGIHNMRGLAKHKFLYPYLSSHDYLKKDNENSYKVAKKLEAELGGDEEYSGVDIIRARARDISTRKFKENKDSEQTQEEEEGIVIEEDNESELLSKEIIKKEHDLTVQYLRRVFAFCFYCLQNCDSVCDLIKKCPAGHERRSEPSIDADEVLKRAFQTPDTRAQNWIRSWTDRFNLFLDSSTGDLIKLGGNPIEEITKTAIKEHIKQQEAGKFRCKVPNCTKLFKGEEFVWKHIEKRHVDWLEEIKHDGILLNNYVLDACRVLPPKPEGNLPYISAAAAAASAPSTTEEHENEADSEQARIETSKRPEKFCGLPIAFPQLVQVGNGIKGVPSVGYFSADPFAYGNNDVAETKFGSALHQGNIYNINNHGNLRPPPDRRRRNSNVRSRSPPSRWDRDPHRRDYRDRRDDRREQDLRFRPAREYDNRGRRDYDDRREVERISGGDPRGRALRSYMDLDTPGNEPELDY
ncbi:hypothetical protein V1514DRAFT_280988 [Lipomyces japonicus]|uniref:uncharacterized protein n=1 Tax=Lipomyces japonicus TaxID=56871 RepID=UPI0034CD2654